ncbi:hypothetical protein ARMGADRAFT_944847 [Armillaria gallica]|uniref:Uncharacterized protein n=1 Tax=Armillaria gallica TaxID=47427 RepID=A0A2H3CKJ3_ARMGA|nr:hypothetical protein ARMGADRAFT_944847 [Armillaria gallica]
MPKLESGICCGYTMMRVILAAVMALVHGDQFYVTDLTLKKYLCSKLCIR